MRIYYSSTGEVVIEIESIEDEIIWNNLIHVNTHIHFNRVGNTNIFKSVINEPAYIMVGSTKVSVPPGVLLSELKMFHHDGLKFSAVKYIKEVTGMGLKEIKDWLDEVWDYIYQ